MEPVVDEENPCYCPTVPSDIFLNTLDKELSLWPRNLSLGTGSRLQDTDDLVVPFSVLLHDAFWWDDEDPTPAFRSRSAVEPRHVPSRSTHQYIQDSQAPARYLSRSPSLPACDGLPLGLTDISGQPFFCSSSPGSALRGPPERGLSPISFNDESFALSGKAERLRFSFGGNPLMSPGDNISLRRSRAPSSKKASWLGPETPRSVAALVNHLEAILPGVRLHDQLLSFANATHQNIVDILATEARLTAPVLELFRTSEVVCLDLVASMREEDGLNLGALDMLRTLAMPDSFLFLLELNFSGVTLSNTDILYFNRLPRLSRLWLSDTGIGNEAIYHLVALKRSLQELDLSLNQNIDDDVIPAFLLLRKLLFLSLTGTAVSIVGMRRFASSLEDREGGGTADDVQVEPPQAVEEYLDALDTRYLLDPVPPLIVDPGVASQLSVTALKRNLAAHAACNGNIMVGGTKAEMVERLSMILRLREDDLAVKSLLEYPQPDE